MHIMPLPKGVLMRLLTFFREMIEALFRNTDKFEVLIGAGSESNGFIRAGGTVKIEGRHTGSVAADNIIVLEGAYLRGDIQSREVTVAGAVEGDVIAEELVEVRSTGRIDGDINSQRLSVAAGGVFNGYAHIYKNTEKIAAFIDSKAAIT